jgi:hypothetical protein
VLRCGAANPLVTASFSLASGGTILRVWSETEPFPEQALIAAVELPSETNFAGSTFHGWIAVDA